MHCMLVSSHIAYLMKKFSFCFVFYLSFDYETLIALLLWIVGPTAVHCNYVSYFEL